MKVRKWIRNASVVVGLSMAACIPVQAALVLVDQRQSVAGDDVFDYRFTPAQNGTVTMALTDVVGPVAVYDRKLVQGQNEQHAFGYYDRTVSELAKIPEPGICLMMLGGIGLLGWLQLRKS